MCFPQLQGIVRQSRIYLDLFSYVSLHTCILHTKTWHQTLRGLLTFSLWRKTSVYISRLPWTCIACVLNAPWEAKNTVSKCLFFLVFVWFFISYNQENGCQKNYSSLFIQQSSFCIMLTFCCVFVHSWMPSWSYPNKILFRLITNPAHHTWIWPASLCVIAASGAVKSVLLLLSHPLPPCLIKMQILI